jgi:DEAD/DEAH box helicase domain-containing protein
VDASGFLSYLQTLPGYSDQLAHVEAIPDREPRYSELREPLSDSLQGALQRAGIESLYSHQAEAVDAVRAGVNVIVSTPSASGKSLCYHLPVLDALAGDKSARALLLFPTKALAQDQSRSIAELAPKGGRVRHDVFDGDTPLPERGRIRRSSRLVITNPDMLHRGILPNHQAWYGLLKGLRFVVLDEAHVYRGVFGSHVANVMRRLRRLCLRFGSDPQFILCSATLANPGEHAERLVGLPFRVVTEDGGPFGGKDFAFWNPPMIDIAEGTRRSTAGEAALLLSELMLRRVRTLAFVKSRQGAELLTIRARERLSESEPGLKRQVAPYRASYLPEDRRRIERDLFEGRLTALTTTSAMELGIDVGDLDATVLTGYPGSIASTWQQAGRSGRRGERALSVLVAQDDPLDQYLMRHPDSFFEKAHESARTSSANPYVLKPQMLCAAYEAPLTEDDAALFGPDLPKLAAELESDGFLQTRNEQWHLAPEVEYPSGEVNIRSASGSFFTLVDDQSGAVLETVEEATAYTQLHPGSVYLHQAEDYLVSELDLETHTAYAQPTDVPYYTQARHLTDTRILNVYRSKPVGASTVYIGEVSVSTTVMGFRRRSRLTHEVLGEELVDLPTQSFHTVSLWLDIPPETLSAVRYQQRDLAGGLHAMEHAAIGLLPLFALCDRNDIGGVSTPLHPDTGRPQVFIHDGHPGGVGITEHGYDVIEELCEATVAAISECPCDSGCPSCVHSPKCGNNNQPLDKGVAVWLLRDILHGPRSFR